MAHETHEPIAIIGIGCRFPGGVKDLESYWRLLADGVDAITEIPADRFDVDAFYDPRPATPGKVMTRWGGFLDQIDQFDAYFFGISPREAERLDPQQRLLLETAREALDNAGQVPDRLMGSQTGVFVGMWLSDFEARLFRNPGQVDFYMTTGSGRYSASGRLSYIFGLEGPSLTLDTACSSSLSAVHLACRSLRSGESTLALAGAANVILQPHITIAYSQSKMMAPDGHCKFGDARANGYVRSEGAAVVVLKRLSQALADGDPIHAVILGSAMNNDGRSSGFLTTPGGAGQEDMLRKAYCDAGISPGQVQYVEAHGTGTLAGDPVEINALGAVLSEARPLDRACRIGSVKTNFGHTESVAGLAGLIKVVLSLKRQQIPASLHVQELNPSIPWDDLPLRIQRELGPWPAHEGPALAGVSAFGITGTNAHIVLQAAPESRAPSALAKAGEEKAPYLLPLSAHTPEALGELAQHYRAFLNATDSSLADIAYTAAVRRAHHDYRLAVCGYSREELVERLGEHTDNSVLAASASGSRKIVFVCPGQGSQWVGMGRQLLAHNPTFRQAIDRCELALKPYVDWSLIDQLTTDHAQFDDIAVIQPTLFAIQVALAAVWQALGVQPDAVIGHSLGEVAAAHIAGALSLDDAARIICTRSHLMQRLSGQGAMAVVELSRAEAQAALQGYEDRLSVAVSNGPRSTVLSGDPTALQQVVAQLQRQDIFCRLVKVDVAAHSPQMETLRPELVAALAEMRPQPASIPVYSTVEPTRQPAFDAEYWGRNLRQPVLFAEAVQRALADGLDTFIELSPHPILLQPIAQAASGERQSAIVTAPSLRREADEPLTLLASLGTLYASGYAVDWQRVYPAGQVVSLPTYPWQRERFWIDQSAAQPTSQDAATGRLGAHIESASQPGAHLWNVQLDLATMPYLADHRVANGIVLPAAAYVDMALQAATEILGSNVALEQVSLQEMLVLSDKPIAVQIVLSPDTPGANGSSSAWSFRIFSRSASQWTLHAAGTLRPTSAQAQIAQDTPQVIQARSDALAATEHYRAMTRRRLDYGPAFQGILQMWRGPNEALSRVRLPESLRADDHAIHPSLLDAALQTLLAAHVAHPRDTYLPVGVDALQLHARPESELWVHATLTHDAADAFEGDVRLLDEAGQIVLEARGVRFQRAARDQRSSLDELFYQVQWVKAQLDSSPDQDVSGKWLIFADTSSVRQALVDQLRARGAACVIVTTGQAYQRIASDCYQIDPLRAEDFSRLLSAVSGEDKSALRGVVHLWSLDAAGSAFDDAHSLSIGVLHLTQALVQTSGSPRLWLVTRNAHPTNQPSNPAERGAGSQPINQSVDPLQSSVWGLGGVIAHEHSELRCTRIDLSASPSSAEIPTLLAELITDSRHDQIAVRDDGRYVARLARAAPASTPDIQSKSTPFKVETTQPGVLENLLARAAPRTRPAPGQVEIEVRATGLNFMNVMSALGVLPGYAKGVGPLGIECAGVIVSVGDGVEEVHVGDEIVAIAFDSLGTHAVTDARLVYPKPGWLSFEQAATIPIAFITAYYALHTLAHVQRGERVLIHAAAGGVGLAAVQIAQHLNAEIFATAGSAEKREFLRGLGVQHVLDSRSLAFADEVLALTAGRGVDAVLNSLAGAAMTKSLATLAPYGRFLEIGKRDIYQDTPVGLSPFQKNLSYFAIDLDRMSRERPAVVGGLLREVMQLVESGVLSPLPLRVFPVADVVEAFRHMAQAKHIGKIVIAQPALQPDGTLIIHPPARPVLASDATYLITGGLGALGLAVAQRLVELGARQLVLVGRSGAAHLSDSARQSLERIERQGARVVIAQADVANHDELAAVFDQIKQSLPPLRGVIHAAGILDDGILLQQTAERFQAVLSPKVRGAYNLHQLTRHAPLDFFVMFSSIAATLGTPGQSSYAAANAFLDGLAHHRRALGLPALSINWGPWGAIGLAAQGDRVERLAEQGIDSLTPDEGLNVFERLLRCGDAQLAVMPFDARQWRDAHPMDAPLLHDLLGATAESSRTTAATIGVRETLLAAEPGHRRRTILETYLQEQAAQVLRIAPSRIDPHKSLRTLGMDSLMTIELRNRIGAGLGLKLSATLVWNYPTVAGLAPYLAKEMGIPLEQDAPVAAAVELAQTGVDLDQLSTTEVEALLADELNAIDKFLK